MNILHVCHNYYPSVGGPQYILKHASEKLVEYYNDEVEVCTTDSLYAPESKIYKKVEPSHEVINGVTVNRFPFNRWHYPLIKFSGKVYGKITNKELPFAVSKYRSGIDSSYLNKAIANSKADVVMGKTIVYNFADYPTWRFKTGRPKPFVLYGALHLHVELNRNSPTVNRAKICDSYIANTEYEKQKLIEYGVDGSKIMAIGTGIDMEPFSVSKSVVNAFRSKHGIAETDILIGYIGRLVKGKGVAVLIDAVRKLQAENKSVKLLLAGGTTDYVPEIKRIIREETLPIILIESFEDELKPVLYNALDIFVLASQSESFGIVFLEAWASRKPVVATRMGALESLMDEGVDSLLFQPKNVDELYAQLKKLVNDPAQRKSMGDAGYKKVADNFTWKTIISKYRSAYELGIENFNKLKARHHA